MIRRLFTWLRSRRLNRATNGSGNTGWKAEGYGRGGNR